jgi:hypothetical protein
MFTSVVWILYRHDLTFQKDFRTIQIQKIVVGSVTNCCTSSTSKMLKILEGFVVHDWRNQTSEFKIIQAVVNFPMVTKEFKELLDGQTENN